MARLLRLKPRGSEGRSIEAEIGQGGILFLYGKGSGLALAGRPADGALAYSLFTLKGRSIEASPLRFEVALSQRRAGMLVSGDEIAIGGRVFSVEIRRARASVLFRAALFALCAAAAVLVALFSWRAAQQRKELSAPTAPAVSSTGAGSVLKPDASSAEHIMEEAREDIRKGMPEQARMALIEAAERGADSATVSMLLQGMSLPTEEEADWTGGIEAAAAARARFEEALEFMLAKQRRRAHASLHAALAAAGASIEYTLFAEALGMATAEVAAETERGLSEAVDSIMSQASAARPDRAEEAVGQISRSLSMLDRVILAHPDSRKALAARRNLMRELSAASARWLAKARAAERLSGCAAASAIYARIAKALDPVYAEGAGEARGYMAQCAPEGGTR